MTSLSVHADQSWQQAATRETEAAATCKKLSAKCRAATRLRAEGPTAPDMGVVDAHPEADRAHHDGRLVPLPPVLHGLALRDGKGRVEGLRPDALRRQLPRDQLAGFLLDAEDDGRDLLPLRVELDDRSLRSHCITCPRIR